MNPLSRLVDEVDKWPLRRLLIVNTLLGGFAALANGGAMVLTISGKDPAFSADLPYMAAVVAGAVTVLLLGLGARFFPQMLRTALRGNGVLLRGFGCLILLEGIKVAVQGPPEGIKFTWNAVMVVALVTYSVYFAR